MYQCNIPRGTYPTFSALRIRHKAKEPQATTVFPEGAGPALELLAACARANQVWAEAKQPSDFAAIWVVNPDLDPRPGDVLRPNFLSRAIQPKHTLAATMPVPALSLIDAVVARPWLARLLKPVANWYVNAAGYRQMGLR